MSAPADDAGQSKHRICRTPEEAYEAGRAACRARGDKLTDRQRERIIAILRPHFASFGREEADQQVTPERKTA